MTLSKPYYQPVSFETTLKNELVKLENPIVLKQGQGKALVTFEPFEIGVQLQVDGKNVGELPQQVNLPAGKHSLKAIKKGKAVAEKILDVKHGSNQQVVLNSNEVTGGVVSVANTKIEMVAIPAGSFQMGSNNGDSNEKPVHTVNIKAFAMSKTEITFAQWDACVKAKGFWGGGCSHKPGDSGWGRGNRPVINVSYKDITQQFIPWLNKTTDKTFRLPSESEWEYAARAGSTTKYPWGDSVGSNNANCNSSCGDQYDKTAPVGSFAANAFGLHDMHGNVWEWTQDCWNGSYSGAPSNGSAWSRGDCAKRVLRGGSWSGEPNYLRSAIRFRASAAERKRMSADGLGPRAAEGATSSASSDPSRLTRETLPPGRIHTPGPSRREPSSASRTGKAICWSSRRAKWLVKMGGMCCATTIGTGNSASSGVSSWASASGATYLSSIFHLLSLLKVMKPLPAAASSPTLYGFESVRGKPRFQGSLCQPGLSRQIGGVRQIHLSFQPVSTASRLFLNV